MTTETLETSTRGIYLYCLALSDRALRIEKSLEDDQEPIDLRGFGDLAAVTRSVPLAEYCGASAEENLSDLNWVGPRACRHESVIERVMRESPVLPARFGTLFSSVENVRDFVAQHHDTAADFLRRVSEHEEWAVKGVLDRPKAHEAVCGDVLSERRQFLESLSPGRRHLEEKRLLADAGKRVARWLKTVSDRVSDELAGLAAESCPRRIYQLNEDGPETVLNWAFLVRRERVPELRERVVRLNVEPASQGLSFDLAGPWPPYSFVPSLANEPPVVTAQRDGQGPQRMTGNRE